MFWISLVDISVAIVFCGEGAGLSPSLPSLSGLRTGAGVKPVAEFKASGKANVEPINQSLCPRRGDDGFE